MVDIFLHEVMHGREGLNNKVKVKPAVKSKFDKLTIKYIDELIGQMPEEEFFPTNQFETPLAKKEKARAKMIAEANALGFHDQIKQAIEIINTESIDLEIDQLQEIKADFIQARKRLDEMDLSKELVGEVKDLLGIRQESINSIFSLAITKYQKEEFEKSMCLFLLLSKLDSEDSEYLYRAGIAAQVCGQLELALKLYSESLKLNTDLIGSKIFSIECQLDLGFKEMALKMHSDLQQELTNLSVEEKWVSILEDIGNELKIPSS